MALFKVVLPILWGNSSSVTIQVTAIEPYFPAVLFIMLCKAVLSFDCVDEFLKCDVTRILLS